MEGARRVAKRGEKKNGKAELALLLDAQAQAVKDVFQMMDAAAPRSLEKPGWAQVTSLADEVSRQATVAGMLWSGDLPGIESLKESIVSYFKVLQSFIIICYGSTVGAGPTLTKSIRSSAQLVLESSLSLFKEAVYSYESCSSGRSVKVPQLAGTVWEACASVKKCPSTNCVAIGRALAQVGVYLKDIVREMEELPISEESTSASNKSSKAANVVGSSSDKEDTTSDFGDDDLSPEEAAVARLVVDVVSESLTIEKELIRFVTGLVKSASWPSVPEDKQVELLEELLTHSQALADHINDLAANVYPPQDATEMEKLIQKLRSEIGGLRSTLSGFGEPPESATVAMDGFERRLGFLGSKLCFDAVEEMQKLSF